jgi:hypothetical protein
MMKCGYGVDADASVGKGPGNGREEPDGMESRMHRERDPTAGKIADRGGKGGVRDIFVMGWQTVAATLSRGLKPRRCSGMRPQGVPESRKFVQSIKSRKNSLDLPSSRTSL